FTVMLPKPVLPIDDHKEGTHVRGYKASGLGHRFAITIVTIGQDTDAFKNYQKNTLQGVQNVGVQPQGVVEVSGKGYKGVQFSGFKNGKEISSNMAVLADGTDVAYNVVVDGKRDDVVTKTYFGSFVVDPTRAAAAHSQDDEKDHAYATGYTFGRLLGFVVVGLFLATPVIVLVAVIILLRKRKAQENAGK
ncbi:MAG: hypothetical protein ACRD3W_29150, partial [Terriglobales bacterium]